MDARDLLERSAGEPYCYLTTTGRRSGRDREIEIWFATDGTSLFLILGGAHNSDWVRNLLADAHARVRLGEQIFDVRADLPLAEGDERDRAVEMLHGKYSHQVGGTLDSWREDAFIVALRPAAPAQSGTS